MKHIIREAMAYGAVFAVMALMLACLLMVQP
jgi:hypothetical protein